MTYTLSSGTLNLTQPNMHCDHTVHFSVDLSWWLDSPIFRAPWCQSMFTYSQPSFSSSTWKRGVVWMCKLGMISQEWLKIGVKLLLNANRKSYMPNVVSIGTTTGDLEWLFHALHWYPCGSWASCFFRCLSATWNLQNTPTTYINNGTITNLKVNLTNAFQTDVYNTAKR